MNVYFRKSKDKCYYISTGGKHSYEKVDWVIFYFKLCFDISYEVCGYFDNRPRINLDLIFFRLELILPFRNKWTDECDSPKWGIAYHNQKIWIYRGGKGNMNGGSKWWTFTVPWAYDWVRTSNLKKDGTWEHETKGNRKEFWSEKWNDILWKETHPYKYILKSGEVQQRLATIKVAEREWRWRSLKWTGITKRVSKTIEIDFNDEVGERTGSWKGGTTGCSYNMLINETPVEALRRMEKERKFN